MDGDEQGPFLWLRKGFFGSNNPKTQKLLDALVVSVLPTPGRECTNDKGSGYEIDCEGFSAAIFLVVKASANPGQTGAS